MEYNRISSSVPLDYSRSLGSVDGPNTSADAHRRMVPEEKRGTDHEASDRKYQAFPSGLSYHAWEVKLRSSPLRSSSILDELYKKNRSDPNLVNDGIMSVLTDISVLERAFMSMYLRHGQLADGEKLFKQVIRIVITFNYMFVMLSEFST